MRLNSATIANVAFTLCCLMFLALGGQRLKEGLTKPALPSNDSNRVEGIDGLVSIDNVETQGEARAGVALIEFSDFQCPFCGRYAKETYETLKKEFVDSGKAKYSFMHFPLGDKHPLAQKASEAAECAGRQGQFWPMHGLLFGDQEFLTPASFNNHARALGLQLGNFESCLNGEMTPRVRGQVEQGQLLGVKVTPTFLLGRIQPDGTVHVTKKILGAQPIAVFREVLGELLKGA